MSEIMPPKKKPDSGAVGVYDVEIMNEDELKLYIEALKEESERMKTAFTNHQRDKRELEDLLKNTQDDILSQYEILMQKEIELQQLLSDSRDTLNDEYKQRLIKDLETIKVLTQNLINNFIEVQQARMFQQDELKKLQKHLEDREKEVDNIKLAHRILSTDLKEQTEEEWTDMIEKRRTSLEEISEEYNEKQLKERSKLFDEEHNVMNDILDSCFGKDAEKYPSTDQAEKMSWYFKDIFWKNVKASGNLRTKVDGLEKELNKLKMLLKDAEDENKELLKNCEAKNQTSQDNEQPVSDVDDFDDKQLDYLTYENYALNEKLRQVTEERNIIKDRFISAMRNIYEKADFASFLSEQILACQLNDQQHTDEILHTTNTKENDHEADSKASIDSQAYDVAEVDSASSSTIVV